MDWKDLKVGDVFEYYYIVDTNVNDNYIAEVLERNHCSIHVLDHFALSDDDIATEEDWNLNRDKNGDFDDSFVFKRLIYHHKSVKENIKSIYPEYFL